ncbi:hypothetical protein BJF85_15460 [Saccharomonospora sp. CUA-673]|uniref:hypothetical protein n=1 Tax=Saccharomonospora sp. CUA-673 TaxID=1904969 RepID=UPI0009645E17|nr:hypothetical protein [Saccharomonospora sp. CUA-673]OLT47569.1 hypothetical protein BJF85_15460 [Saccharomonospora sp. CUA-673]
MTDTTTPTTTPATTLPAALARALTPEVPGPPVPPGPRVNPWHRAGAVPVAGDAVPERLRHLLDGLWRSPGYHRLPDGTATRIRQRPVPSAGATYPVHTHLVVGPAGLAEHGELGELGPGRYVFDHEHGQLLRRRSPDPPTAWEAAGPAALTMVLTVQPGRSVGRYRHRAWPLWIADVAYAVTALEFLLPERPAVSTGPAAWLRALLDVPRAAAADEWLGSGLAPEIPLAAVDLPPQWTVDAHRARALAARRSPALAEFAAAGHRPADPRAAEVARLSGQTWVRGAARVETWSVSTQAPAHELAESLWQAHRQAAALCYRGAASGRWRSRPVSGIPARNSRWITHALAMLPGNAAGEETDAP